MAGGPPLPDRTAHRHPLPLTVDPMTGDAVELRELVPRGPERPRPSRCRLRDGRGRRTGGAHPGARRVGGRAARRPHGVAHHGRVESLPRHDAFGRRPPRPGAPIRHRPAGRRDPEWRRHAAPLLPVRAPRPDVVVRGRVDPPGCGWSHDAPDRAGLPRARGDDGAAHQPGQAHGRPGRRRSSRRRGHGDAGAVPRLQRGLFRRRRSRGRGDPADPAAGLRWWTTPRSTGCSP